MRNIYISKDHKQLAIYDDLNHEVLLLDRLTQEFSASGVDSAKIIDPKPTKKKPKASGLLCNCGRPAGHNGRHIGSPNKNTDTPSTDDVEAEVHRLQKKGLTSIQIAQRLHLSLMKVNAYWDADIAVNENEDD